MPDPGKAGGRPMPEDRGSRAADRLDPDAETGFRPPILRRGRQPLHAAKYSGPDKLEPRPPAYRSRLRLDRVRSDFGKQAIR